MKVLIQNPESRQYVAPCGGWTSDPTKADDFVITTLARRIGRRMPGGPYNIMLLCPIKGEMVPFMDAAVCDATKPRISVEVRFFSNADSRAF